MFICTIFCPAHALIVSKGYLDARLIAVGDANKLVIGTQACVTGETFFGSDVYVRGFDASITNTVGTNNITLASGGFKEIVGWDGYVNLSDGSKQSLPGSHNTSSTSGVSYKYFESALHIYSGGVLRFVWYSDAGPQASSIRIWVKHTK
ncbi:MAG: hypothetical protein LBF37_03705 [Rickettsiales bacterium]|nr:hypothetical protein [Rickettsiales bacterium]